MDDLYWTGRGIAEPKWLSRYRLSRNIGSEVNRRIKSNLVAFLGVHPSRSSFNARNPKTRMTNQKPSRRINGIRERTTNPSVDCLEKKTKMMDHRIAAVNRVVEKPCAELKSRGAYQHSPSRPQVSAPEMFQRFSSVTPPHRHKRPPR